VSKRGVREEVGREKDKEKMRKKRERAIEREKVSE
jgi:hypothetical protein